MGDFDNLMDLESMMLKQSHLEMKQSEFRVSIDAMEQMKHPGTLEPLLGEIVKQINQKLKETLSTSEVVAEVYEDPKLFARIAHITVRTTVPMVTDIKQPKPPPVAKEEDKAFRKVFLD